MKVEVGQDATGRWAWMVRDEKGCLIASGDDYWEAALALEAALRWQRRAGTRQGGE